VEWEWGEPWTIIGASIGVGSTTTGNGGELRIREAVISGLKIKNKSPNQTKD